MLDKLNTMNKIDDAVSDLIDVLDEGNITKEQFENIENIVYKLNRISEKLEK